MTREEAILYFEEWIKRDSKMDNVDRLENIEIYKMAIKALEQEPFINKPCVSSGVCEHDKQMVLEKIRAELIQSIQNGTLKIENGNEALFDIIDKYKAESEDNNDR